MSEDHKKRKVMDSLGDALQVTVAGIPGTSIITGAHSKYMDLESEIQAKDREIKAKDREIKAKDTEVKAKERQVLAKNFEIDQGVEALDDKTNLLEIIQLQDKLRKEKSQQQKEKFQLHEEKSQLQEEKSQLYEEKSQLYEEKFQLKKSYTLGTYYAATSDVWVVQSMEYQVKLDDWMQFMRVPQATFHCRHVTKTTISTGLIEYDPYKSTRAGALDTTCTAPDSVESKNSSTTQSEKYVRDVIWPRDIFGREDPDAEIALLLPDGHTRWKEWTHVAAAMVMLPKDASIEAKKKATIGYKKEAMKRKEDRTGVMHFVSNKIRLSNQKNLWNGNNHKCLLVPVMSLKEAKSWSGERYNAVFLIGHPFEASQPFDGKVPTAYEGCRLASFQFLVQESATRDATPEELLLACTFLEKAVLALGAMVANLGDDDINQLKKTGDSSEKGQEYAAKRYKELMDTRKQAQNESVWKVPKMLSPVKDKKPACLVTFGSHNEKDCHPAPDPLLLVMKSANVWTQMSGLKLIVNGAGEDDNFSERDYMEMEAFIEERERSYRASTWEELAVGLGQPTGYCEASGA